MAEYNYKKIQKAREALKDEITTSAEKISWTVEHDKLVEMRLQTTIMAGLEAGDILKEVKVRDKDK